MDFRKVYDELYGMIEDLKKQISGGLSQSVNYDTQVTNLPKVNNITLKGNKKSSDLKIAYSMTESEYAAATKNAESIYCLQENAGTITDSAYVNLEVADWVDVSGVYKQTKPFVFEVTPAAGWTIEDVSIETGIATVDSYEVTEDPFGLSITYAAETLPEYGITATVTVTINQPAGATRIVKGGISFGNELFSTAPIKVGKWIDGKDLYRKVVTASVTGSGQTVQTDISTDYKVVSVTGGALTTAGSFCSWGYYNASNDNFKGYIDSSNVINVAAGGVVGTANWIVDFILKD